MNNTYSNPLDPSILTAGNLNPILDRVQQQLASFAGMPGAAGQLLPIFTAVDRAAIDGALAAMSRGDRTLTSRIQVLDDAAMHGARGAYASGTDTIYLSASLVAQAGTAEGLTGAVRTAIEEIGHRLDHRFHANLDSPGDEGELFSARVTGLALDGAALARITNENDWGTITLHGQEIVVERDDTPSSALNLGVLNGTRTFTNFVGSTDANDYYRFTLNGDSNFRLTLSGLTADGDVDLLDAAGNVLTSGVNSGSTAELIAGTIAGGTYYVRVYPGTFGSSTNYNLSITGTLVPPDTAGNTLVAARNIGALTAATRTFQEFVGTVDVNDYYRFTVGASSLLNLALTGLDGDADVYLLNSAGQQIGVSGNANNTAESIQQSLVAGTYYVKVTAFTGNTTNYALSLSAIPDSAGNTLATARNVGALSALRTFQDNVGANDSNDYYRFTLGAASNFRLALNGMTADADVQLLNSAGQVITSSTSASSNPEAISRALAAGTYYVRVFPYTGSTNYNLSLMATALPADSAGNTLATAKNLGALTGTRSLQEFVGTTDPNDYYRFTLSSSSYLTVSLNGLSADGDVQLLNASGQQIAISNGPGVNAESITASLAAGTYYIRIYPEVANNTSYNLGLSVVPAPVDNAGNTLALARNIGVLTGTRTFQDFVGRVDTNDYYKFTLNQGSSFRLALNGMTTDADVQLLNASGIVLDTSNFDNTTPEAISRYLAAGTYYVRVYPYGTATNYNLSLTATPGVPADTAGNTLVTARNLGALTATPLNLRDFVGVADPNDYYKFTLSATSNFSLNLRNLSTDADVRLLNASGATIVSSVNSGSNPEAIDRLLAAGTYYIQVFRYSGDTVYDLQVSATPSTANPNFSTTYGYGLTNAALAVARGLGQTAPFANVADLGGNNWGADLVNAPEAWARGYRGQGIIVAVIDTGVDYNHADLDANIWTNTREIAGNGIDDDRNGYIDDVHGWDFVQGDNDAMDVQGHGTHVAGTIAAENNGVGNTGVAYGARIMPVRVLGDSGSGTFINIARGIRYAADNGARVINLSLGGGSGSPEMDAAINYAAQRGAVVVMASGNEGAAAPGYPARLATTTGIAVGAVDRFKQAATFSNAAGTNSAMQYVVAPGVDVYSTQLGGGYRLLDGTSMATPHVAGVVALMLSANPNLTAAQVRSILTSTASRLV
jgi:trimeric autotransporter adhesin